VQGVFQVAAVLPVNYVIQEMEDIFNPDNDVSAAFSYASSVSVWWARVDQQLVKVDVVHGGGRGRVRGVG